jgi:hypothetical protein
MIALFASNSKQHRDQRPCCAFHSPPGPPRHTLATHPLNPSHNAPKSREEAHHRRKGSRWQGSRREERGGKEDCCSCGRQEEAIQDSEGNLLFLYLQRYCLVVLMLLWCCFALLVDGYGSWRQVTCFLAMDGIECVLSHFIFESCLVGVMLMHPSRILVVSIVFFLFLHILATWTSQSVTKPSLFVYLPLPQMVHPIPSKVVILYRCIHQTSISLFRISILSRNSHSYPTK